MQIRKVLLSLKRKKRVIWPRSQHVHKGFKGRVYSQYPPKLLISLSIRKICLMKEVLWPSIFLQFALFFIVILLMSVEWSWIYLPSSVTHFPTTVNAALDTDPIHPPSTQLGVWWYQVQVFVTQISVFRSNLVSNVHFWDTHQDSVDFNFDIGW